MPLRLHQMSTVLALPVASYEGSTISLSDIQNGIQSTRKLSAIKKQLELNDLTDNEVAELVQRRADKV